MQIHFPHICLLLLGVFAGVYDLELFLTEDYPMVPPKVHFLTQIYVGCPAPRRRSSAVGLSVVRV